MVLIIQEHHLDLYFTVDFTLLHCRQHCRPPILKSKLQRDETSTSLHSSAQNWCEQRHMALNFDTLDHIYGFKCKLKCLHLLISSVLLLQCSDVLILNVLLLALSSALCPWVARWCRAGCRWPQLSVTDLGQLVQVTPADRQLSVIDTRQLATTPTMQWNTLLESRTLNIWVDKI